MARRYSVAAPNIGRGGADLIRAGGGGVSMKAPKAQNWVSSSMSDKDWESVGELFGKNDAIRKKLEDTGLYPMDFLKTQNSAQLSALYQKHLEGAPGRAKAEAQKQRDIAAGEFRQRQEKLISEPMNWPGSLYDPSIGDPNRLKELPMPMETQKVEDELGLGPGTDDTISDFWQKRGRGERREVPDQVPDTSFEEDFPLGKAAGEALPSESLDAGLFEWFRDEGVDQIGEMKKHMERDEEGRRHGTSTEWREDGSVKKSVEYNHGEMVSRIEYDKQGNIEKTTGDPFKTKEEPAQKTTDALAALFQGLDPRVASEVLPTYRKTQEALRKEPTTKVPDPFKNSKEVTRWDPKTNRTYVRWIEKGTGRQIGDEQDLGELDPEKGDYTTTFDDDSGKNIITLDRAGNTKKWITIEKDLKEKNWNPQVLVLADFLKDGIMEEMSVQGPFKNLLPQQQKAIMSKAYANAKTPAQYVATHNEIIPALNEFGKEKGKLEQVRELIEAIAKLGSTSSNQGNTLRDKLNKLKKR